MHNVHFVVYYRDTPFFYPISMGKMRFFGCTKVSKNRFLTPFCLDFYRKTRKSVLDTFFAFFGKFWKNRKILAKTQKF